MKPTNSFFSNFTTTARNIVTSNEIFVYLLAAYLIAIPLGYAIGSIISGIFILSALVSAKRNGVRFRRALLWPMLLYVLMAASVFWTRDLELTLSGLRKEALFLLLPFAFLFIPDFTASQQKRTLEIYAWGMVGLGVMYVAQAALRFFETGNLGVFFYHELVTLDVNAIYVAVLMSSAFFYFFAIPNRSSLQNTAMGFLAVVIVLLSSKSVIFIDFILVCCYYLYFASIRNSVKWLTAASALVFVAGSIMFIPNVRKRFLVEYETAFVDNTINRDDKSILNISLSQAWNEERFEDYHYFPGGALRVYQTRTFVEMMEENPSRIATGFGLEATQAKIKEKEVEHNLHAGYGDYNFHNQYIQTFAELGILGFVILLIMVIGNLRKAFSTKNFPHIVFAVTMLVLFLTESFFCRQRGIIFFVALYCFFNAVKPAAPEETK